MSEATQTLVATALAHIGRSYVPGAFDESTYTFMTKQYGAGRRLSVNSTLNPIRSVRDFENHSYWI